MSKPATQRRRNDDKNNFDLRIAKGAGGKGPRQKTSKIVRKCQNVFRHFSTIFAQGKKSQKSPKSAKKFLDNFRAAPFFRPLLQSADLRGRVKRGVGRGFEKRVSRGPTLKFYCRAKAHEKQHFGKSHFYCRRFFPRKYSDNNFGQLTPFHPPGGRTTGP